MSNEIENEAAVSYVVSEETTADNVVNQWLVLRGQRLRVIGIEQSQACTNFAQPRKLNT